MKIMQGRTVFAMEKRLWTIVWTLPILRVSALIWIKLVPAALAMAYISWKVESDHDNEQSDINKAGTALLLLYLLERNTSLSQVPTGNAQKTIENSDIWRKHVLTSTIWCKCAMPTLTDRVFPVPEGPKSSTLLDCCNILDSCISGPLKQRQTASRCSNSQSLQWSMNPWEFRTWTWGEFQ